ncbi:hypothetical protein ARMGADRAFT_1005146 [Armillaria gallica]|uniref:Uncharacterized protein n=1 Tax=Armillaria gallica TaxID=47427 RepID=A0A2H3EP63_ARMGA|nr:hypothetical protein ARMGADRAFT_1005146 [Armillaria gallica]
MRAFSQHSSSSTLLATNLVSSACIEFLYTQLLQEFSSGLVSRRQTDDTRLWREGVTACMYFVVVTSRFQVLFRKTGKKGQSHTVSRRPLDGKTAVARC